MSIEALNWALVVPIGGNNKIVLLGLANHAHPNGRNAFPSVPTLATYAFCSERTVQRCLRELETEGWIKQTGWFHIDGRADRRVAVYALAMTGRQPVTPSRGDGDERGDTPVASGVTPTSPEPSIATVQGSEALPPNHEDNEDNGDVEVGATTSKKKRKLSDRERARKARASADRLPSGFPDELRPHAEQAHRVLTEVAEQWNAREVTMRGVGLAIMGNPNRRFVAEAYALASWAATAPRAIKDVVGTYRTWLGKADRIAGVELLGGPIPAGGDGGGARPSRFESAQRGLAELYAEQRARENAGE